MLTTRAGDGWSLSWGGCSEHDVVKRASEVALQLEDCEGFAIHAVDGVQFYSEEAFDDDGNLCENAEWTAYTPADEWEELPDTVPSFEIETEMEPVGVLAKFEHEGWVAPAEEEGVLREAQRAAGQLEGCVAFALHREEGVRLYTAAALGGAAGGSSLEEAEGWTAYVRLSEAEAVQVRNQRRIAERFKGSAIAKKLKEQMDSPHKSPPKDGAAKGMASLRRRAKEAAKEKGEGPEKEMEVKEEKEDEVSHDEGAQGIVALSARAQKKWDQLDADGSGVLEGEELVAMAEWVWSSFRPGQTITPNQRQREVVKVGCPLCMHACIFDPLV